MVFVLSEEDLPETINVLNIHASIKASMRQRGSEKFYRLFSEFITALKNSGDNGIEEECLKEQNSPLYNAYFAFMDSQTTEVTQVMREELE